MTTDLKKWAKDQERERIEKYENRGKEHASFYRGMDDERLLEEVARNLPGCSDDMCFACLDNEALINELRRRIGGEIDEW